MTSDILNVDPMPKSRTGADFAFCGVLIFAEWVPLARELWDGP
jgi:hypothetical protein